MISSTREGRKQRIYKKGNQDFWIFEAKLVLFGLEFWLICWLTKPKSEQFKDVYHDKLYVAWLDFDVFLQIPKTKLETV